MMSYPAARARRTARRCQRRKSAMSDADIMRACTGSCAQVTIGRWAGPMGVSRLDRLVAVIPQPQLNVGSNVRSRVYLHLLSADNSPAALGFDIPHGRLRRGIPVAHAVAVRHLEEPVPGADRPELHRFEQDVVTSVAHGSGFRDLARSRGQRAWPSLPRRMRKNGDRSQNRATNMRTIPAPMMPTSDQTCAMGATCNDCTTIQTRNPAAPSGSTPASTRSQALLMIRRR